MNEVYLVTNLINNKRYVGITCRGYLVRWKEHVLNASEGSKVILHNAIRKYGADNFRVELLESDVPDDLIESRERHFIELYQSHYSTGQGYNMTEGGGEVCGYHHTETSKSKISESLKGHRFPESRNIKIQQAMTGREYKPEWREALSAVRKGRFTKDDNPFYGKHHTDLTKSKISKANSKHRVQAICPSTGEVVRVFANTCEAGRWIVSSGASLSKPLTCSGRIGEVCRGCNPKCTAYGYHWRFEERSID